MNNGKICVPVCSETADEMIKNIRQAEEFADVIEVRFDCLKKNELEGLLFQRTYPGPSNDVVESTTTPLISTFRSKEQGGGRELSFVEREAFWTSGHETEYCDVEEDVVEITELPWLWGNRICSYHDFLGIPPDLEALYWRLANTEAEKVKIAVQADDITDAIPVWKLLEFGRPYGELSPRKVIPVAMGDAGKWTRILGLAHGAYLTYAALGTGDETAPGQITARDMIEVYRVKELDQETKVYGIIGDPVAGSLSPYMLNPAFTANEINAVYLPLLVKDLDAFIVRMVRAGTREVELNFGGFSVTMPHKQAIMKHLDAIDPVAEAIGAVNTVKIDGDKLIGYNTDAYGFITPLKEKFGDLKDARVAVFGAGGAARACVYALKQENADVTVFARDIYKAESFGEEFAVKIAEINKADPSDFDILVDTTPLGMKGPSENDSLFTAEQLKGVKFVYDLVTKPDDTPIMREAKKAGIPAIDGTEMLIAQGAKQFEIWTGRDAPVELMRNAILTRTSQ